MIQIPYSQLRKFHHEYWHKMPPVLRYGQAFHQYMEMHKVKNEADKAICDRVHEAASVSDTLIALHGHIDWEN